MATQPAPITIQGPDQLPEALNYRVLQQLGLDTVIKTGSEQWTDYNEHDPGITILEILSLATADLSYRTTFSIEDILTIGPSPSEQPNYFPDQFYLPSEILTSSPVTLDDLRKKVVDISGVANAWVEPLTQQQTPLRGLFDIIISPTTSVQQTTAPFDAFVTQLSTAQVKTLTANLKKLRAVKLGKAISCPTDLVSLLSTLWALPPSLQHDLQNALNALFNVIPESIPEVVTYLEIFEKPEGLDGGSRNQRRSTLYQLIRQLFFNQHFPDDDWIPLGLHKALEAIRAAASAHDTLIEQTKNTFYEIRPLTRDLRNVFIREPIPVLFNIDILLDPSANPEATLATVLYQLSQYLSPPVYFSSLEDTLRQNDNDINAVFDGPSLQHGFINDSELSPRLTQLLSSQLIDHIRNLPGVLHVKSLHFGFSPDGNPPALSQWITEAVVPVHMLPTLGSITQNQFSVTFDPEELIHHYESHVHNQRTPKLAPRTRDLPIPSGTFRKPSSYTTIQEDFPRIYGLQPHGPASPTPSRSRVGEIRQLQAYLLIFDQILADYLSQLANIGQLFSWSSGVTRTRFFQGLENTVENLQELVDSDYQRLLPDYREPQSEFRLRRNKFLDAMLRHMGRDLTADLQSLYRRTNQLETGLKHRQEILANYSSLSSRRGTGQNYHHEKLLQHPSGLAQWINALAGFTPPDKWDSLVLGTFAQADLQDLPIAVTWMPRYSLTSQNNGPVNLQDLIIVGSDPTNYGLDQSNLPLSDREQQLWQSWQLVPIALTKDQSPVDLPINGKEQIFVSIYKDTFFFRVFDKLGQFILNLTSLQLKDVDPQLHELKEKLEPYWDGTPVTNGTRESIIARIIDLVQYTHRLVLSGTLPDGSQSTPCQLNQTFADYKRAQPAIDSLVQLFNRYGQLSQQITVIEHSLLRPSPREKLFQVQLLDTHGTPWASSTPTYSLVDLQQIVSEDLEQLIWSVTSNKKTTTSVTSFLPPYTTSISKTPLTTSPDVAFTLKPDSDSTGIIIKASYGIKGHQVDLLADTIFDSEEDAQNALNAWIHSVVTSSKQAPWAFELAPYTLTEQEHLVTLPPTIVDDPYSSIITVILPNWPPRFQDITFRETLETIVRRESPSHLLVNILWVDFPWHQRFQQHHDTWLELYRTSDPDTHHLSSLSKSLLDMILQRTYPRMHDS